MKNQIGYLRKNFLTQKLIEIYFNYVTEEIAKKLVLDENYSFLYLLKHKIFCFIKTV